MMKNTRILTLEHSSSSHLILASFHTSPLFFPHHIFTKLKVSNLQTVTTSACRLLHFSEPLCSPNAADPVIALLSSGGIPPFSSAMPPDWIAIWMPFTSHLFEISLTGHKDPKKRVVNRISWPRGEGKIYSWLLFSFPFPFLALSFVNVCKVSAVIFRVKPSISSKYSPFKQTQEAIHTQWKTECIMKRETEWHHFSTDIHSDKHGAQIVEV